MKSFTMSVFIVIGATVIGSFIGVLAWYLSSLAAAGLQPAAYMMGGAVLGAFVGFITRRT